MAQSTISVTYYEHDVFRKTREVVFIDGITVLSVIEMLGLSQASHYIYFVNRRLAKLDTVLYSGDVVKIMPAMAGG